MVEQAKMCQEQLDKRNLQERIVKEGMNLWQKQKEAEKLKKMQEQKEMKEMLERYWPWGKGTDARPRGLRNIRLDELFPDKDYQNAKRAVCTLDHGGGGGTGGGGAPIYHGGRKVTRTKADPLLRFRLGDANLRRCVDNTLRYRTDRQSQMDYKKELDKMVEEKKIQKLREKLEEDARERNQGWSNEETLKRLGEDKENTPKSEEKKKGKNCSTNRTVKLEPLQHQPRKAFVPVCKSSSYECLWNRQGSAYLKELSQQVMIKQQQLKAVKEEEEERSKRHFNTWTGFWGRPGHGAPQPECARKLNLDRLLYPSVVPVGVH